MKQNEVTLRAPFEIRDFLNKFGANRIRIGTEDTLKLSQSYLLSLIIKYFKNNNMAYQDLLKMEVKKHV